MHLTEAFIQSDLHFIQVSTFYQLLLSMGIKPMILALLVPCSTSWATGKPPVIPDEVREHLIRDKRSETIPPDSSDSQLYDGASSLQFISLIFYRVLVRGLNGQQKLGFVISDPFLCCFWGFVFWLLYGWKIQTWPIIIFLTESVTY